MNKITINFLINLIRMVMSSDEKTQQLYDSIVYRQKIDIFTEIDLIIPTLNIYDLKKLHKILCEWCGCLITIATDKEFIRLTKMILFDKLETINKRMYELENRTFSQ